ncbi:MAG: hypothetical protein ACOCYG_00560 [Spirochaetota bacterium]
MHFVLVFLVAFLFFLLIPGIGAFLARHRWRVFRRRITTASTYATAGYPEVLVGSRARRERFIGWYRFFGGLESIQGDGIAWLTDGRASIAVELTDAPVYMVPGGPVNAAAGRERLSLHADQGEVPMATTWKKVGSLPEGTRMFVAGSLFGERGRAVFKGADGSKPFVIMYDGPDETLVFRSIRDGRQQNEYWNSVTPIALAAGSLSLFILAYFYIGSPLTRIAGLLSAALGLLPLSILAPPGVILFFLYRRLWRIGRTLRAERDLLRLPLRYGPPGFTETILPDGEPYVRREYPASELESDTTLLWRRPSVATEPGDRAIVFGTVHDRKPAEATQLPAPPQDPMAERVALPGDPEFLSEASQRRARIMELSAGACILAALLANLYLLILVVSLLFR